MRLQLRNTGAVVFRGLLACCATYAVVMTALYWQKADRQKVADWDNEAQSLIAAGAIATQYVYEQRDNLITGEQQLFLESSAMKAAELGYWRSEEYCYFVQKEFEDRWVIVVAPRRIGEQRFDEDRMGRIAERLGDNFGTIFMAGDVKLYSGGKDIILVGYNDLNCIPHVGQPVWRRHLFLKEKTLRPSAEYQSGQNTK